MSVAGGPPTPSRPAALASPPCSLQPGRLSLAAVLPAADDMCVADELFSHGKLLPLRPLSTAFADAPTVVLLPQSESVASTAGFGSHSDYRSASSSGSSSGCVSRSHSSKSASSYHATAPSRRSLSSSLFYAHLSPSPQLRSRPRRSTGSAPPPAGWGIIRLGVVGAPDVYPPRCADGAKITAASRGGSGRSHAVLCTWMYSSVARLTSAPSLARSMTCPAASPPAPTAPASSATLRTPASSATLCVFLLLLPSYLHPRSRGAGAIITSRSSASIYPVFEDMEHDLAGLASSPDLSK